MIGRYELKFPLISTEAKKKFLSLAKDSLEPDPHGQDAVYRVSSQYFDTPDYKAYWEKQDGEAVRKKYRLRYYSIDGVEDKGMAAFMEIKHRIDNRVFKERLHLTPEGAEAILSDSAQLIHIEKHVFEKELEKRSTIDSITAMATNPQFVARNVITYMREAWLGIQDKGLRVTFDSSCRATLPQDYLDVSGTRGESLIDDDKMIMEVKFDHAIPRWIRDIVAQQGLKLERFSKYTTGLEALGFISAS